MMKKAVTVTLAGVLAACAWAETSVVSAVRELPRLRKMHDKMTARSGGFIFERNTGRGAFAILNAQTRVDTSAVGPMAARMRKIASIASVTGSVRRVAFADASANLEAAGANAGVFIVDEPTYPLMLVAPEGKWAFANVAALTADDPSAEKLASRLTKVLWRGFAYVGGGANTDSQGCVMNQAFSVADLDAMPWDMVSMEVMMTVGPHLRRMGIEQYRVTTYKQACKEGWAPEPTNDVQRAVREDVLSGKERGPSNGIRINPPAR